MPFFNPDIHHRKSIRLPGWDYSNPGWYYVTICLKTIRCMLAVQDRHACPRFGIPGGAPDDVNGAGSWCRDVQLNVPTANPPDTPTHGGISIITPARGSIPTDAPGDSTLWFDFPADLYVTPHAQRPCLRLTDVGRIADEYWRNIPRHAPNCLLDEYCVMPDHIHGIIRIRKSPPTDSGGHAGGGRDDSGCGMGRDCRDVQLNVPTEDTVTPQRTPMSADADNQRAVDPCMAALSPRSGSLSVVLRTWKGAVKTWALRNGHPQFDWQERFYDHIIRNEEELMRIRTYIRENPCRLILGGPEGSQSGGAGTFN